MKLRVRKAKVRIQISRCGGVMESTDKKRYRRRKKHKINYKRETTE